MISLATDQSALMQSASVGLLTLVHLTTYSDREALTVSREFWLSSPHPVRYEWGGGSAREFLDLLDTAIMSGEGFDHLPEPDAVRLATARVNLVADTVEGVNLWKTLSGEKLLRARVEIATLLVNPGRYASATSWLDLTDLAGTEHVVRFRGVLKGSAEISDEVVSLQFEADDPQPRWARASDAAQVDPKDLGRRYPLPFGAAKGVPCVSRVVGWYTTLAETIDHVRTGNVLVTDLTGAPSGSATYQLGPERITATKVDAKTLNITARGITGTIALPHATGEPLVEQVSEVVLGIAGVPISGLDALYVINQATGERIRVTTPYLLDLANISYDGELRSLVRFNQSQWRSLLDLIWPTPPEDGGGLETEKVLCSSYSEVASGVTSIDCNAIVASKRVEYSSTLHDKLRATIQSGDIPADTSREVHRFRVRVTCDGRGDYTVEEPNETYFEHDLSVLGVTVPGDSLLHVFDDGVEEPGLVLTSDWYTPGTTQTLNDLIGDYVEVWVDVDSSTELYGSPSASENYVDVSTIEIECEVIPTAGSVSPRTTARGVAQAGFGLLFVADVQGVGVPPSWQTGYTFNEGTGWSLDSGITQTDLGSAGQRFTCLDGAFNPTAQRNATSGTIDLDSPSLSYRVAVTVESNLAGLAPTGDAIRIYFSNTAGSGTTPPATWRILGIPRSSLVEGEEVIVGASVADAGTPALDNCETIGVILFRGQTGDVPVVIRLLEVSADTNADWGSRTVGELLTEGHDVARWFIEEMAGEEVDATSFGALDTALAGVAFAGQYDAYGETLAEVLGGLGHDLRTNFRRAPSDGKWRGLAASESGGVYSYPATVRTLGTLDGLRESLRSLDDVATHFRAFYRLLRWRPPTDADSYTALLALENAAAATALGFLLYPPLLFAGIDDDATADLVAGFYAHERTRYAARRWAVTVPLWDAYDLEPGDTVAFRPRWRDADAKARVIEVVTATAEAAVGLVLEEVL